MTRCACDVDPLGSRRTSTVKTSSARADVAAVSTSARPGVVTEYCEREYFDADCSASDSHQLIMMRSAVFGRMKEGRCVDRQYGSIGCRADVLATVNALCSGRRRCRFVTSTLHDARPCPSQLVSYLEASFDCVDGLSLLSYYKRTRNQPDTFLQCSLLQTYDYFSLLLICTVSVNGSNFLYNRRYFVNPSDF